MAQNYRNLLDSLGAISLYAKHVKSTLDFSGLDETSRRKIAAILDTMLEESRSQEEAVKQAIAAI
ncbi:MAG: hypothetical protein HGA59_01945 [Chlorobiaceae bacterium]|jgi:hypothetical protein|nr:hypothetical protein [Chlorobiaceae bacterium]NTV16503.1 hypothetical protein [Chlorobiaceae bacterium]